MTIGLATHDLYGKKYTNLIQWCFSIASCLSFEDCLQKVGSVPAKKYLDELSENLVFARTASYFKGYDDCVDAIMSQHYSMVPSFYLFACNAKTEQFVLQDSRTLFSWMNEPLQNLCFYRSDKTILLRTVSHEGICALNCHGYEYKTLPNRDNWTVSDADYFDDSWFF